MVDAADLHVEAEHAGGGAEGDVALAEERQALPVLVGQRGALVEDGVEIVGRADQAERERPRLASTVVLAASRTASWGESFSAAPQPLSTTAARTAAMTVFGASCRSPGVGSAPTGLRSVATLTLIVAQSCRRLRSVCPVRTGSW